MPPTHSLYLKAFRELNTTLLDILITASGRYHEIAKDTIIFTFEGIFRKLKKAGDTYLEIHEGDNDCDGDCVERGTRGYAMVGNHSRQYFILVINCDNRELNLIDTICSLKTDEPVELDEKISIYFAFDMVQRFNPHMDFLMKYSRCQMALDAMKSYHGMTMDSSIVRPWVDEYRSLFKSFTFDDNSFYKSFQPFWSLFSILSNLIKDLDKVAEVIEALGAFPEGKNVSDSEMVLWLYTYEELNSSLTSIGIEDPNLDFLKAGIYTDLPFKIDEEEYRDHIRFMDLYTEYSCQASEHYSEDLVYDIGESKFEPLVKKLGLI